MIMKLKEDQKRKVTMLLSQYEQSIGDMMQQQNVSIGYGNGGKGEIQGNEGKFRGKKLIQEKKGEIGGKREIRGKKEIPGKKGEFRRKKGPFWRIKKDIRQTEEIRVKGGKKQP